MDTKHPLYEVPEAEAAKAAEPDPGEVRGYNKNNWMRNKPCPCGSGRKFKRCCWRHYIK